MKYGMVMHIYNLLSQQAEEMIDKRFAETVDMLEIVPANNPTIDKSFYGFHFRFLCILSSFKEVVFIL